MQNILAVALNALHLDMERVDRVAVNMANVTTPGYKREVIGARPFVDVVDQMTGPAATRGPSDTAADASTTSLVVRSDSRPGTLRMTGQPFDLALAGDGFFEVATAEGPAYTRQGNFHVDDRGRLVTAQGHAVAGKNGDIFLTTLQPLIDNAGNVTEPSSSAGQPPGVPLAQLKIVQFEDPNAMQRLGDGLLAPGTGMTVLDETHTHVRQGALENANVSTIQEMVQLMQTMRHAESMQKVLSGYDEMMGTALRRLGDLS